MAKSKFKAVAGWLHLWVGLVTGLIVVIVSVTGCIYVFDEEIFDQVHHDLVHVKRTGPARPVSELLAIAQKAVGANKVLSNVKVNKDDQKAYVFSGFKVNDKKKITLSYFSQFAYLDQVYVNQYTGQVLGVIDMRYEFFNVVEQLHRQLLLVKPVGSLIVGSCILMFLLMMITGFILWFPKNYREFKQNIMVKWNAKWKRVNYDLHNSFGFYVLPLAMLIAITGLVWSFKWWETGIFKMMGANEKINFLRPLPVTTANDTTLTPTKFDEIFNSLKKEVNGHYSSFGLGIPNKKEKVALAFVNITNNHDGWNGVSYYYFDGRTGKQFAAMPHHLKPLGAKWRNSNLGIHTGRLYGLPTQILAFLAALICASLPVTGFLIWWGKKKKKNKRSVPVQKNSIALASKV